MCKTKERSWIGNLGLGLRDNQKKIFAGLGLLDFSTKKF